MAFFNLLKVVALLVLAELVVLQTALPQQRAYSSRLLLSDSCCYYESDDSTDSSDTRSSLNTLCNEYDTSTSCQQGGDDFDCTWRNDDDNCIDTSASSSSNGCCISIDSSDEVQTRHCESDFAQENEDNCLERDGLCIWQDNCDDDDVEIAAGDTSEEEEEEESCCESKDGSAGLDRYCKAYGHDSQTFCTGVRDLCQWKC